MCENLVLIFLTSHQVEKEKKKEMDINLRFVAAVTSLGVGLTLRNLCMHFDFPQPLAEDSYQSFLKYLQEKINF